MAAKLQLAGGSIYLEEYQPDGTLGIKYFPGTTDEISYSTELETIEHMNTEEEEQVLDGEDVVKRAILFKFTTADLNNTFHKMAFLASDTDFTQTAITDQTTTLSGIVLGKVEDLGAKSITAIEVKDETDTTTYVLGTDYTYDRKWGTLIVPEGSSISAGDNIHVKISADAITDGKTFTSFAVDKKEYRLTYQGRSSRGRNEKHIFEKVSISMDGERTLKSGDKAYALINFTGAVLKHNGKIHTMETY